MITNQTARVLELLKRFNDGQKVCIELLQNDEIWFGKSEKTIRRDLDVIKEYFPESFELIRGGKGEKGCYKAVTKEMFENFMNKDTIALMVQTFNIAQRSNILKSLDIDANDKRLIESKIKKSSECYEFVTKPYERSKNDVTLLKELEEAIERRRYIEVTYKTDKGILSYIVKPYKIVFINENFYLACENTDERYPFTLFRIINIQKLELLRRTFHKDYDIEEFIKNLQTPFPRYTPNFKQHLVDVVVEVSPAKAKFFQAKKFLPSQNIVDKKEDGTLVVSFKVSNEFEVEELVKRWLPHLQVIKPVSLRSKVIEDLTQYLELQR